MSNKREEEQKTSEAERFSHAKELCIQNREETEKSSHTEELYIENREKAEKSSHTEELSTKTEIKQGKQTVMREPGLLFLPFVLHKIHQVSKDDTVKSHKFQNSN
jgi:hypothetical protein